MRIRTAFREKYEVVFMRPTKSAETKVIRVPLLNENDRYLQQPKAIEVLKRLVPDATILDVRYV